MIFKVHFIIAIGETGLDYFHVEKDTADWQRERFRRHIAASNQSGKPMIIHTRNVKVIMPENEI
jgi:TatD DNase family protein